MENTYPGPNPNRPREHGIGQLVIGIAVILVGVLLMLRNFGVPIPNISRFWPLILVAVGAAKLREKGPTFFWGWLLIILGFLYQLDRLYVLNFSIWKLWPVVLIFLGIHVVRGALFGPRPATAGSLVSGSVLSEVAVFGGGDRRLVSEDFRGGQATVVFGGFDLDLSECRLASGSAVVEVFALWGGIDLRVPPGWNVSMKVFPMFGGADDKTLHPTFSPDGSPAPQLVVTGYAIFGGIEVKN